MPKYTFFSILLSLLYFDCNCQTKNGLSIDTPPTSSIEKTPIVVGANRTQQYLPLLKNKNIAIVANQSSVIFKKEKGWMHLVDSLLSRNVIIKKVFAPEHGFRGKADAGEKIKDTIDKKTGIPIISLYGNNKKPTPKKLELNLHQETRK